MVIKAVIPAAGYGTRSLPISKVVPKEMFPICGRPAIDYIIEEAICSGIEEILIIVSRKKNIIMDYYDRSLELENYLKEKNKVDLLHMLELPNVKLQYVRQTFANGLGDAIKLAETFVNNGSFAVMLPDEIILSSKDKPTLKELIHTHQEHDANIIALQSMSNEELSNYGIVGFDRHKENDQLIPLQSIVEKPKNNPPSNLAVVGRYVFKSEIFDYLNRLTPGVGKEIQLTDAIQAMIENQEKVLGKVLTQTRFDIGKETDYIKLINHVFSKRENG